MDEIIEFRPALRDTDIAELRRRIRTTRWPREFDDSWARGVPAGYLRELADHWVTAFDWDRFRTRLAAWPQYTTQLDGQTLHFAHLRSSSPHAIPLVLSHGWPGSFLEFQHIAGPLTEPARHGGDDTDAFHLVIPSLPGFGFSAPLGPGRWGPPRIAAAFAALMQRLGYSRYLAQGGDWGALVTRHLALADPVDVMAMHVNTVFTMPPRDLDLDTLGPVDRERARAMRRYERESSGYRHLQATRPRTLAYALTDSPVGQLAWIVEKFSSGPTAPPGRRTPSTATTCSPSSACTGSPGPRGRRPTCTTKPRTPGSPPNTRRSPLAYRSSGTTRPCRSVRWSRPPPTS